MASSRGDLTAERQSRVFTELAARDRYQRAQQELQSLKASRTVGELQALAARAGDPGPYAQELARAKRRVELEATMNQSATVVTQPGVSVAQADPGAASLTVYLSALGITADRETVATWLNLVPVLALELGSALAGVLVASFRGTPESFPVGNLRQQARVRFVELSNPVPAPVEVNPQPRDVAAQKLLAHLREQGGRTKGSHRALGKMIGMDRSTVGRALTSLAAAGLIILEASKSGSVLRLAS